MEPYKLEVRDPTLELATYANAAYKKEGANKIKSYECNE